MVDFPIDIGVCSFPSKKQTCHVILGAPPGTTQLGAIPSWKLNTSSAQNLCELMVLVDYTTQISWGFSSSNKKKYKPTRKPEFNGIRDGSCFHCTTKKTTARAKASILEFFELPEELKKRRKQVGTCRSSSGGKRRIRGLMKMTGWFIYLEVGLLYIMYSFVYMYIYLYLHIYICICI